MKRWTPFNKPPQKPKLPKLKAPDLAPNTIRHCCEQIPLAIERGDYDTAETQGRILYNTIRLLKNHHEQGEQ